MKCQECYYWDQESLQADLIQQIKNKRALSDLENLGYCRYYPPAPGLHDDPWDGLPVSDAGAWCGKFSTTGKNASAATAGWRQVDPNFDEDEEEED